MTLLSRLQEMSPGILSTLSNYGRRKPLRTAAKRELVKRGYYYAPVLTKSGRFAYKWTR